MINSSETKLLRRLRGAAWARRENPNVVSHLQRKLPLLRLADRRVDAHRDAVRRLALHEVVLPDDERDEVGGHDGRGGELHLHQVCVLRARLPVDDILDGGTEAVGLSRRRRRVAAEVATF